MSALELVLSAQLAREPFPIIGERQVAYLLVELRPHESVTAPQSPLNLGLVLDRSGSMRGPRLQALKLAVARVIDEMTTADVLSVTTFDDTVDLVIPAQPVVDREALKAALELIEDGGGTAMSLGLSIGLTELLRNAAPERISRMVLLTDGVTRGDEEQCHSLADQAHQAGIPIAPLGFGAEWDDEFMDAIGERSGGSPSEYIRTPVEVGLSFTHQVSAARQVIARGMQVQAHFVAGVTPRRVTRVAPFTRLADSSINGTEVQLALGDLEYGSAQSFLIELAVEPKRGGTFRIAQIDANYHDIAGESATVHHDVVVTFSASTKKAPVVRPVVLHYVERVTAARIVLRALAAPTDERALIADAIANLFEGESREAIAALRQGAPLTPEGRKALLAQVRELTRRRRMTT